MDTGDRVLYHDQHIGKAVPGRIVGFKGSGEDRYALIDVLIARGDRRRYGIGDQALISVDELTAAPEAPSEPEPEPEPTEPPSLDEIDRAETGEPTPIEALDFLTQPQLAALEDAGITTTQKAAETPLDTLKELEGIGKITAAKILSNASRL